MTGSAPVLSARGLRKDWVGADRRFSLTVEALDLRAGEVVALSGPSGSGKSTLLEMLGLASRPDAAERFTLGADVDALVLHRARDAAGLAALRARRIGYVVQTGALLPFLTAGENVALTQRLAGVDEPALVAALMRKLEIDALAESYPGELSVGQRQRVALARALATRPALVLADEPTAALDPALKVAAIGLIVDMAEGFGAAALIATHEEEALRGRAARRLRLVAEEAPGGAVARLEAA